MVVSRRIRRPSKGRLRLRGDALRAIILDSSAQEQAYGTPGEAEGYNPLGDEGNRIFMQNERCGQENSDFGRSANGRNFKDPSNEPARLAIFGHGYFEGDPPNQLWRTIEKLS
jgi:hypothetical protein